MLGKQVDWNANAVRTPGNTCILHEAAIRDEPNRRLEESIWGGQTIGSLALSRTDAAKAFGPLQTPVFEDHDGCAYSVSIDHNRMIMSFPSGYIYLLDRSPSHP